ncbi:MAG: VOC family protein [Saprospiraceae bacterium]
MTTNNPTPSGYSRVCPYLMVDSIEVQIDFLQKVFNADIKENLKNSEGIVMHGEVKIGDIIIMMGRGSEKFPSTQGMNYVYVNNVDEVYNKAIELGSTSVSTPTDQFYGLRDGGFKDPQGNTWFIAQFIKNVSVEDMEKGFVDTKS